MQDTPPNGSVETQSGVSKALASYVASSATLSHHPVLPFLYFLAQLALNSGFAAQVLMENSILSLLRTMCINGFPHPARQSSSSVQMKRTSLSDVYAACSLLLCTLSTHPSTCRRLLRKPGLARWFLSLYYSGDFIGIPDQPTLQWTWANMEKPMMRFLLVATEHVLRDLASPSMRSRADYLPLIQIQMDVVGLLRYKSLLLNTFRDNG